MYVSLKLDSWRGSHHHELFSCGIGCLYVVNKGNIVVEMISSHGHNSGQYRLVAGSEIMAAKCFDVRWKLFIWNKSMSILYDLSYTAWEGWLLMNALQFWQCTPQLIPWHEDQIPGLLIPPVSLCHSWLYLGLAGHLLHHLCCGQSEQLCTFTCTLLKIYWEFYL